ncbi:MAG TPA: STAS domain-containing protein [Casimicrobiaceae bacterium]|jgi:anti-sigma B factor antagonist/stage II sporulation protein AA (anti-sigma F factor antagonist)
MEFLSRQYADVLVAAPLGRIDHAASASLEQRLVPLVADAGTRLAGVVLDFGGVVYISSVGLRVLMIASKSMRAQGKPISVAALQPVVSEIFTISRFDKVLPVFSSVRDALANVSPAAQRAFDADPESPRA